MEYEIKTTWFSTRELIAFLLLGEVKFNPRSCHNCGGDGCIKCRETGIINVPIYSYNGDRVIPYHQHLSPRMFVFTQYDVDGNPDKIPVRCTGINQSGERCSRKTTSSIYRCPDHYYQD